MKILVVHILLILICNVFAKKGFGPNDQEWGYVKVREKANMFWWLHHTTADKGSTEKPLVIWLQGGPGGSSTGIGNFHEIGPWDENQLERNISWVKNLNVLFVDNPVGTGFSYVENAEDWSLYAQNNTQIAQDFLVLLKGFLDEQTQFQNVPIYIFGQSYGGKMAVEIALLLDQEIKSGNINCNLKGIGLVDAWISPIDSMENWSNYLLNLGFIDLEGYNTLETVTQMARNEFELGIYDNGTKYFHVAQAVLNRLTTVDYYNILRQKSKTYNFKNSEIIEKKILDDAIIPLLQQFNVDLSQINWGNQGSITDHEDIDDRLFDLMDGPVKETLNLNDTIPINWGEQSENVFQAVKVDFMKPVTEDVEKLLNETDIEVFVYSGQLDLIVNTPGTIAWVNNLNWSGADQWKSATRTTILVDDVVEGFAKKFGNFNFYWINRAGHAVPADNPQAMEFVLRNAMNYSSQN